MTLVQMGSGCSLDIIYLIYHFIPGISNFGFSTSHKQYESAYYSVSYLKMKPVCCQYLMAPSAYYLPTHFFFAVYMLLSLYVESATTKSISMVVICLRTTSTKQSAILKGTPTDTSINYAADACSKQMWSLFHCVNASYYQTYNGNVLTRNF